MLSGLISSPDSIRIIPEAVHVKVILKFMLSSAFSVKIVQSFLSDVRPSRLCVETPLFLLNAASVLSHTKFLHFKEENRLSEQSCLTVFTFASRVQEICFFSHTRRFRAQCG